MFENKTEKEKVILVGVDTGAAEGEVLMSLAELEELVDTAGAEAVLTVVQNREHVHPGLYLGTGKVEELKELIATTGADGIVCDDELSPAQMKNLEDELHVKVMDRTLVILDIFAQRASSREGKVQVELAQLKYNASHLVGMRSYLSRLGGGIGTRGPGEKKLEMDRRLIGDRISALKAEIADMEGHRQTQRKQRDKSQVPLIAIVGYTNAGKSTLLNKLTDAGVLQENKLFATLDPTTRSLKLPCGKEVLLTDTVGFIRKLPHNLIDAFRSTLEEAKYADVIIHVVDASNPQMDRQMQIVYKTLKDLGVEGKPVITLFNKMDRVAKLIEEDEDFEPNILTDANADETLNVTLMSDPAEIDKFGQVGGLDDVLKIIEDTLRSDKVYVERLYSYANASQIQLIRKYGELIKEEYTADGIYVEAYVPQDMA